MRRPDQHTAEGKPAAGVPGDFLWDFLHFVEPRAALPESGVVDLAGKAACGKEVGLDGETPQ